MISFFVKKTLLAAVLTILIIVPIKAQSVLNIGSTLPLADRGMEDISGRNLSLNDISKENGVLILFSSNTCPWVLRMQDRIIGLADFADENDIGMVALNPNEGYRERGDNLEEMIKHAEKVSFDFPYLLDENHIIADALGASVTPEVFLFDGDLELVYSGSIGDNVNGANSVPNSYVQLAIEEMLSGSVVQTSTTQPTGCSIKRGS